MKSTLCDHIFVHDCNHDFNHFLFSSGEILIIVLNFLYIFIFFFYFLFYFLFYFVNPGRFDKSPGRHSTMRDNHVTPRSPVHHVTRTGFQSGLQVVLVILGLVLLSSSLAAASNSKSQPPPPFSSLLSLFFCRDPSFFISFLSPQDTCGVGQLAPDGYCLCPSAYYPVTPFDCDGQAPALSCNIPTPDPLRTTSVGQLDTANSFVANNAVLLSTIPFSPLSPLSIHPPAATLHPFPPLFPHRLLAVHRSSLPSSHPFT